MLHHLVERVGQLLDLPRVGGIAFGAVTVGLVVFRRPAAADPIRTFLSSALELEISARWLWHAHVQRAEPAHTPDSRQDYR